MTISRSHIAYGAKDDIRGAITAKKIPKNCLIVTKITDPYEQAELFYYDKEKNLRALSTKEVFSSLEAATAWVNSYYCVGRQIVVLVDDEWHLYTVDAENNLVLRDGSDKVADIAPEDSSIHVGGTNTSPTISIVIDPVLANGLDIGEDGILLMPATQQTAGAISAADKTKLDGIEAGAEVNTIRDIGTGSTEGTISVNGVDVRVKGLGSAAFTDSNAYQPMGTGMNYAVVEELPDVGRTDTIYLKENKGEENNVFDEFLYVDGVFELVGTTKTDLSDYYTRGEADRKINSVVTEALIPKANSADLARVATTGSYNDLLNKPKFPIIVTCKQRSDGYYYAETPFTTAKNLLKQGLQVSLYWPSTSMIYQCTIYSDNSNVMYYGVMDNTTYRFLQWSGKTNRVEEYSNITFAIKDNLKSYYTKDEVDEIGAAFASISDIANKVDKVDGKGLSTNDFTDDEKNKLAEFEDAGNYVLKSDLEKMYKYKGSVSSYSDLPKLYNYEGDVYNTEDTGMNYAWDGIEWDSLGATTVQHDDIEPISSDMIDSIIT